MLVDDKQSEPRLEETKRIARVLRIVQMISAQPRVWTRRRLSQELEIGERMIDKDLELIRHGLCFDLRRVPDGYYFQQGPLLKPLELTASEALALALAAQQARDTGTVDAGVIGGVLAKIEAALPRAVVPYLRRAGDAPAAPFAPAKERAARLALLKRAMAEGRKVELVYATASRGGSLSRRVIAPYYLQPYERSWQVIAEDSRRGAVRMFKVDRIVSCELAGERYSVPDDFDPVLYLGSAWGVLRGESGPPEDVVLRFSAQAARWVRGELWHASQVTEELPGEELLMQFHCGVTHELVRWVLGYGAEVSVELPDQLRNTVVEEAKRVVDNSEPGGRHDEPA